MSSQTLDDDRIGPELALEELTFPPHVGEHLATLYGEDGRISTGAEWVTAMREASRQTQSEPPTEDDLCYLDDGNHTVEIDGETASFVCVLDPLVVPFLRGSPGTVRSVTPEADASVTVDIDADGATADPDDAVVSLGVSRDPDVDAPPTHEDIYTEICPYVHVFETVEEYERWAAGVAASPPRNQPGGGGDRPVDAASTSIPVETGVAVARELAGELFARD